MAISSWGKNKVNYKDNVGAEGVSMYWRALLWRNGLGREGKDINKEKGEN